MRHAVDRNISAERVAKHLNIPVHRASYWMANHHLLLVQDKRKRKKVNEIKVTLSKHDFSLYSKSLIRQPRVRVALLEVFAEQPKVWMPAVIATYHKWLGRLLARILPHPEWHRLVDPISGDVTYSCQTRLWWYAVYENQLGQWTLDDGEAVSSHPTVTAAKAAAYEHSRSKTYNDIIETITGKRP
jgi:hypothetical protein